MGGTFTDVVVTDSFSTWRAKSPTDPADFACGVLDAVAKIATQTDTTVDSLLPQVGRFGLGTTAVTNVVATRGGVHPGLITTAGFEWHALAARGRRVSVGGFLEAPWTPIDEHNIRGVRERTTRDGLTPLELDVDEVLAAGKDLIENEGVEALAVSFLWSFRHPANEALATQALRDAYPDVPVFSGAELHPVIREYERTIVALLNAVCANALSGIETLEDRLAARGMRTPLLVLQATGGTTTVAEARRHPLALLGSGPAAGVVAAAEILSTTGHQTAITCDLGGTSLDVSMVIGGEPERRQRGDVHGHLVAQSSVDVESVGAGGGSIAWVDGRGLLRVGPRSARAVPGPVCYGRGGVEPTLTDAMVVLGYIEPSRFLAGSMPLDGDAAAAACEELGAKIGLTGPETAWGIREVALADMIRATRSRISAGGHDPRHLTLVTSGGSGSLFAPSIAAALSIPTVVAPAAASVLSAFGAASAEVRHERLAAYDCPLAEVDQVDVVAVLNRLADSVDSAVANDGVEIAARAVRFEADVRFFRQAFHLPVPLEIENFDPDAVRDAFLEAYALRYGRGAIMMETPIELAALRAIGTGAVSRAAMPIDLDGVAHGTPATPIGIRAVRLERHEASPTSVFVASELRPGHRIDGPALIDDTDTTLFVPSGGTVHVDKRHSLNLEFDYSTRSESD
ncbi:hydantoinase/oxoprolinase family protein [Nocardia xishanensis]|uniref:Hydantoinase/oxoprolinase family protein n=1 Tax=Nocardia xishanensis TaxID=238964 RepID=A0ABW7X9M9_9NOCA